MKYFKINHKLIYGIILIIFLMQIILISHRNSFSFVLIKDFYKKCCLEKGIKNREIFDIITIIKKIVSKILNYQKSLFNLEKLNKEFLKELIPQDTLKK